MSDDYTIHIKASVDGGGDEPPKSEAVQDVEARNKVLEEFLKNNTHSTEPSEAIGTEKRGRGRPRKDTSDELPQEDKDEKREDTALERVLKQMKEFASFFDGHNGRITKALNASLKGATKWADATAAATKTAQTTAATTQAAGQAAQSAAQATAAAGASATGFGATLASIATAAGPVAIVMAGAAVAVGGMIVAIKAVNASIAGMLETVGEFSGAVNIANAKAQVAEIQNRMNSANQIGGEVADLRSGQTEMNTTINKIWTNFYDLIYPFLKVILLVINNILKALNSYLEVLVLLHSLVESAVEKTLELLTYLPFVGKAAGKMLEWMRQDEINNAQKNDLNLTVEEIFSGQSLGLDKDMVGPNGKKRVEGRFL